MIDELALGTIKQRDHAVEFRFNVRGLRLIWPDLGVQQEPWIKWLESALRVVEADVRATGLGGSVSWIHDGAGELHVVFRGGGSGSTHGIEPLEDDPICRLVEVADDLQNSVMHMLWGTVWPCAQHTTWCPRKIVLGCAGGPVRTLLRILPDGDGRLPPLAERASQLGAIADAYGLAAEQRRSLLDRIIDVERAARLT